MEDEWNQYSRRLLDCGSLRLPVHRRIPRVDYRHRGRNNRKRTTTYGISVPSEDAKIVVDDYSSGKLTLASAKDFVGAFNKVTQRQKSMRVKGETSWHSSRWIRGEC
jgi:hypothetical protein